MNIQDQRLENKHTIRTKVCKVCFGALVEKHTDGHEVLVCAADPAHEGFISQTRADAIQRSQRLETHDVLKNYPQFNPSPVTETAQESIASLWG